MKVPTFMMAALGSTCHALYVSEPTLPHPWTTQHTLSNAITDHKHAVLVQLPMQNVERLKQLVSEVSDPASPRYGQYLTNAAVNELTAPKDADVTTVDQWLAAQQEQLHCGLEYETLVPGTVRVEGPVDCVGALFDTTYRTIVNPTTNQKHTRAAGYHIPDAVAESIVFVSGMHQLPVAPRVHATAEADDIVPVTPSLLEELYNVSGVVPAGSLTNRQAVVEFQNQYYLPADLSQYFKTYVPDAKAGDDQVYQVVGNNIPSASAEASLDIQVIMGVAPGIKTEFWGFETGGFCDAVLQWSTKVLQTEDHPNVFSISYGWQGEMTQVCPDAATVIPQIDANLAKIAALGVSILISSGDSGSGYDGQHLSPSWPASSPYVTAVGGTTFITRGDKTSGETATTQFGSGGGFSSDFDRTDAQWQESFVTEYLQKIGTSVPSHLYDASGRGTPDVSALAENYPIYIGGRVVSIGGTSASAPFVAALIALLNEKREQNGKPSLGLLNPLLYQNPQAFTPVLVGTNAIGRQGQPFHYGWNCTTSWDAATGLGSPLFDQLLQII